MKSEMCLIVVSPLVSVTRDQVLGFSAAAIGLCEEYEEDEKAAREEKCEFFFGSPETWLSTAIKPLENGITRCFRLIDTSLNHGVGGRGSLKNFLQALSVPRRSPPSFFLSLSLFPRPNYRELGTG